MTLASGTAFAGYRIEAEIGRGGMGVVDRVLVAPPSLAEPLGSSAGAS